MKQDLVYRLEPRIRKHGTKALTATLRSRRGGRASTPPRSEQSPPAVFSWSFLPFSLGALAAAFKNYTKKILHHLLLPLLLCMRAESPPPFAFIRERNLLRAPNPPRLSPLFSWLGGPEEWWSWGRRDHDATQL